MNRRILVTAALPYANGHIHLGHLVEYLQTDIWVRFQKLAGNECLYVCADDTHGTAIMNRARIEGRPETEVIAEMQEAHLRDFQGFGIQFDNYGSTNSEANRELCHEIWRALRAENLVVEKDVEQLFDPEVKTFLADRFVKGTCPICKSPDQYGDNCDKCSATYSATELTDPISTLSGAKPELRTAKHLFVELEKLHPFLEEWTQDGTHLQPEVANYLKGHFLGEPLRDWDISRPAPYFGFEIPDSPGNYWYVWFDAPIGYIASTKQWCDEHGEDFDGWWKNPATEIHHFIGKDITYFHTLFWPAMLKVAGFTLPTKVHIHGFLNVGGEKMSKTKGTFVRASTYLEHLEPAYLRYYFASKLGPRLDDLDLNLDEFVSKINSDLVGKVVNLASRATKILLGLNPPALCETEPTVADSDQLLDEGIFRQNATEHAPAIAANYEDCDYGQAMRRIMAIADTCNEWINRMEPWKLKGDPELQRKICTCALNHFRQLAVFLAPVLPDLATEAGKLLNAPIAKWSDAGELVLGKTVNKFEHLMQRVDPKKVAAMIEASREEVPVENSEYHDGPEALAAEPLAEVCTIDDFVKVDLRVARVLAAAEVAGSDKLLQLTVTLGGTEQRNIFAGIKAAYAPESLVGRLVVIVANLAPRKMRFGISEGMVVAAGPGGSEVFVMSPDTGAVPGQRLH